MVNGDRIAVGGSRIIYVAFCPGPDLQRSPPAETARIRIIPQAGGTHCWSAVTSPAIDLHDMGNIEIHWRQHGQRQGASGSP